MLWPAHGVGNESTSPHQPLHEPSTRKWEHRIWLNLYRRWNWILSNHWALAMLFLHLPINHTWRLIPPNMKGVRLLQQNTSLAQVRGPMPMTKFWGMEIGHLAIGYILETYGDYGVPQGQGLSVGPPTLRKPLGCRPKRAMRDATFRLCDLTCPSQATQALNGHGCHGHNLVTWDMDGLWPTAV